MEQIIYVKRFIKTEDDLPKEYGNYMASDNDYAGYYWTYSRTNKDSWLDGVKWYLQPTTLAELIREKLPSKKEIEGEAMTYSSYPAMPDGHPEFELSRANDFDAGANFVINKLTEQ